jgi:pimeloyl-ACP methyl ester carboxylesterase
LAQTDPQREIQTGILEIPGARLYYEAHGSGAVMLMVPGASGTAESFKPVTEHLAAHYTVIIYDRRGFSRSQLVGPQDYDRRLETDADDVRRLIEHVSDEPAIVFGSSSGALVGLEVLTRHPALVRALVPHEPPAMRLLPDGQKWVDFFFELYALYRQSGIEPALETFREKVLTESDWQAIARAQAAARARDARIAEQIRANSVYWFEHELRQYPAVEIDVEALKDHADRVVPMAGRESNGYPAHEVSVALAEKLGRDLIELPGGHIGFVSNPGEFARELLQALSRSENGSKP